MYYVSFLPKCPINPAHWTFKINTDWHFYVLGTLRSEQTQTVPATSTHLFVIHACFHTQQGLYTTQHCIFFFCFVHQRCRTLAAAGPQVDRPTGTNPPLLQMASQPLLPKSPCYIIIASWFCRVTVRSGCPKVVMVVVMEYEETAMSEQEEAVLVYPAGSWAVMVYTEV